MKSGAFLLCRAKLADEIGADLFLQASDFGLNGLLAFFQCCQTLFAHPYTLEVDSIGTVVIREARLRVREMAEQDG